MSKDQIALARNEIDRIDERIHQLLNERATFVKQISQLKQGENRHEDTAYYRPDREALIMSRLKERNEGPLTDQQIQTLFREIISCCLSLEQPLTIAYLGPPGTYTESAVMKQFGHFAKTRSCASIDDVFREVESENIRYGVVPVENSTEGMVNHTLDCFVRASHRLQICAEVQLQIHHSLIVPKGVEEADIKTIYSHEQSLAQCRMFLDAHFPKVQRNPVSSNAEAARIVASMDDAAAIAGELAAEQYNLEILHQNIEDHTENTTRFLVIGLQKVDKTGDDKTSILLSTRNESGALLKVLAPFEEQDINLSRLEARPGRDTNWSYVFFIDFDGHESDPEIQDVLAKVREVAVDVRSLGSYPKAFS